MSETTTPQSERDCTSTTLDQNRFETVLSSINEGVFTVDNQGLITCFNRAAQEMTGFEFDEAIGRPCRDILRAEICGQACALRFTMETGRRVDNLLVVIRNKQGQELPVSVSTAILKNEKGEITGGVETFRDMRQIESLKKELTRSYNFHDIVSQSPVMQKLIEKLRAVAVSDSSVLIEGESGTGKELVARALHDLSARKKGPFVAVNCGGLPNTLIETELFGHRAGAFTGAQKSRAGRFELAKGGTIFLDEIGDMALEVQAKLLRVLETKNFEPLGSSKPVQTDARVLAATNRNLSRMVKDETFRGDLFFRLNVIGLTLPPLRERKEDIPLLVEHFIFQLAARRGKSIQGMTPEAMKLLFEHDYPGNVRELRNIVEHGVVLCRHALIGPKDLPESLLAAAKKTAAGPVEPGGELSERELILKALEQADYNRQKAARLLGIHKTTLYRRLNRLGIELPGRDGRGAILKKA